MPTQRNIQVRAPAFYLLVGMIGGLCAAKQWPVAPIPLLAGSLILALVSLRITATGKLWGPVFLASALLAFWAYGGIRLPHPPSDFSLSLPPREASLILNIERVMQTKNPYGKTSGIARVVSAPKHSRLDFKAPIYFRIQLPEDESLTIQRGMQLGATAVLKPIRHYDEDSFDSYLKSIGVHYRFDQAIAIEQLKPPSTFDLFCQEMNERFQDYLRLGEPNASEVGNVYSAMLLGRKVELSAEQNDRFRMTGTMHLFAISGLHIGVIATVIAQFLVLIRVPRPLNPLIGLPLLFLYVEITGASPSAVRAFLMALFFWASFGFQRQRNPFAALVGSAVLVLIVEPTQLWSMGFQLSYSVVLSILLFGLPLHEQLSRRLQPFRWLPKDSWTPAHQTVAWTCEKLSLLFAISFSAWIASTPLSAGLFGFIAPGAVFLNMLLVNLAALVITGGIISMACALIFPLSISAFLNHSAWVVISAMDAIVILFTQIPGSILACERFPMGVSYTALLVYFILLLWSHHGHRSPHAVWRLMLAPLSLLAFVVGGYLFS